MCGRFYVAEKDLDDFAALVNQVEKHLLKKAREIYPGDYAPAITPGSTGTGPETGERKDQVHALKWGFPTSKGKLIINARSETIAEKPMFRNPFRTRRCLIPARGFYEWKDAETGREKVKFYIAPPDSSLIYLAGIYWFFSDREGNMIPCFTIVTTSANEDISPLHHRMPVVIERENKGIWLYEDHLSEAVRQLMLPARAGLLLPVRAE
jgi:putative SOS response-associated peptidase YedK